MLQQKSVRRRLGALDGTVCSRSRLLCRRLVHDSAGLAACRRSKTEDQRKKIEDRSSRKKIQVEISGWQHVSGRRISGVPVFKKIKSVELSEVEARLVQMGRLARLRQVQGALFSQEGSLEIQ